MEIKGNFKVMKKTKRTDGNFTYELGDMSTFSVLRITLPTDLELEKVLELAMPVRLKAGKYGLYFELAK